MARNLTDVLVGGEVLTWERLSRLVEVEGPQRIRRNTPLFDVAERLDDEFARYLSAWLTRHGVEHELRDGA